MSETVVRKPSALTPTNKNEPIIKKSPENPKRQSFTIASLKQMEVKKASGPKGRQILLPGNSVYLFSGENAFRQFSSKIVGHPYFDSLILFLIGFSTILLTLESPLDDPQGTRGQVLA